MTNCPKYLTTGVCRFGNYCMRYHNRPTISPTLLFSNMYRCLDKITPGIDAKGNPIDPNQIQEHFEDFYEDIFKQFSKYGEIMCLYVCDNVAHHMAGNVYVQFHHEKHAEEALKGLQGKLFNDGRPIRAEYSPVTDFYYARCKVFEKKYRCNWGFKCDFLHVKKIRRELMQELYGRSSRSWYSWSQSRNPSYRRDGESRKRSHERGDHRDRDRKRHERLRYSRSRSRSPSVGRDRERSHERGYHRDRDRERHERLRYSRSWSRRRSPSFRRDRERSHERGDLRDRDRVRHEMRYERMSRRSRYRRSRSRSRSPSYRRYSRERSHERGDQRRSSERDRDRERRSRSPVRVSSEEQRAKIQNILGYQD